MLHYRFPNAEDFGAPFQQTNRAKSCRKKGDTIQADRYLGLGKIFHFPLTTSNNSAISSAVVGAYSRPSTVATSARPPHSVS